MPVFPSLREEAKLGYDVKLSYPGYPIFLQFKLSDWLSRNPAKYFGYYDRPYYRIPITRRAHSRQHNLLKGLADGGEQHVYYVAPQFHTIEEFDDAYSSSSIMQKSRWMPLR